MERFVQYVSYKATVDSFDLCIRMWSEENVTQKKIPEN